MNSCVTRQELPADSSEQICDVKANLHVCLEDDGRQFLQAALDIFDCRRKAIGKEPSGCLVADEEGKGETLACPRPLTNPVTEAFLGVLFEFIDECHPLQMEQMREELLELSTRLIDDTRDSTKNYIEMQDELRKLVNSADEVNAILEDHALVGRTLSADIRGLNRETEDLKSALLSMTAFAEEDTQNPLADIGAVKFDEKIVQTIRAVSSISSTDSENPREAGWRTVLESPDVIYCGICTCLFVCLLAKRMGKVHLPALLLTAVSALKFATSDSTQVVYLSGELVVSHVLLLLSSLCQRSGENADSDDESIGSTWSSNT